MDSDPDFEFFDSHLPLEAATSPSSFLPEDFSTDPSQYVTNFGTPNPANQKSPAPDPGSIRDTRVQSLSASSTASPAGSYQDSSSESSVGYKRKSSSDSSRSALTSADIMMGDDADMVDWQVEDIRAGNEAQNLGAFTGTIDPSSMNNFEFSDQTMENDFDFESAASSPSPFGIGPGEMDSPEMPTIKYDTPRKYSPMMKTKSKKHTKAASVRILGSRKIFTQANRIVAAFSHTRHEWFNDCGISRGLALICHGHQPRILAFCLLQQFTIPSDRRRIYKWDYAGWWGSECQLGTANGLRKPRPPPDATRNESAANAPNGPPSDVPQYDIQAHSDHPSHPVEVPRGDANSHQVDPLSYARGHFQTSPSNSHDIETEIACQASCRAISGHSGITYNAGLYERNAKSRTSTEGIGASSGP